MAQSGCLMPAKARRKKMPISCLHFLINICNTHSGMRSDMKIKSLNGHENQLNTLFEIGKEVPKKKNK